jgi:nucleoside-diphosphate-sugar epimerase
MTPRRGSRGSSTAGPTVAVTGAAGQVGQAVCRRLVAAEGIAQVLAVDTRRPAAPGVTWRKADPADPAMSSVLRRVDVLVHLAVAVDPELDRAEQRRRTTMGASVAVTAAAATGIGHVVVLSSARVYGAHPDNPVPLPDDAPLRGQPDGGVLGDLLEVEANLRRAARAYPKLDVAILRPALLVGPGLEHAAAGLLDGERLTVVRGTQPSWQFCHVDDLASAVEAVIEARLTGPIAVASEGWLEQDEVEEILGRSRLELPASTASQPAGRLPTHGSTGDGGSDLSYVMYPWVVAADRLAAVGWRPSHTNAEALASYAEGRPVVPARSLITAKRAAAAGGAAAGAAALVGTAALVRRVRKRRTPGK